MYVASGFSRTTSRRLRRDLHNRAGVVFKDVQLTLGVPAERGNQPETQGGGVLDQVRHDDPAGLGVNGERPHAAGEIGEDVSPDEPRPKCAATIDESARDG